MGPFYLSEQTGPIGQFLKETRHISELVRNWPARRTPVLASVWQCEIPIWRKEMRISLRRRERKIQSYWLLERNNMNCCVNLPIRHALRTGEYHLNEQNQGAQSELNVPDGKRIMSPMTTACHDTSNMDVNFTNYLLALGSRSILNN